MNKNKLTIGILLLIAGLVLDMVLPHLLFRIIAPISMGGQVGIIVTRLIALVTVSIVFVKGGRQIIQSMNKGKVRSDNAKAVLVGGLLIFLIPKSLLLLAMISYDLSYLISGYLVFIVTYFIHYILAMAMVLVAFLMLTKKQTLEEIEEENRLASQPATYTKFTYIGISIVSLPFLMASLLLFEQLYLFPDDFLLPKSFTSSNLYWSIAIVTLIFIVLTQGLDFYKVVYRDSSGSEVGFDKVDGGLLFQNQVIAAAMTFIAPIFMAAIIAIFPYYVFYFTFNFFLINVFTKILLILLILIVFGALFFHTRKNKNKTGEFLWLVSWFFLGLIVLFILYLFL